MRIFQHYIAEGKIIPVESGPNERLYGRFQVFNDGEIYRVTEPWFTWAEFLLFCYCASVFFLFTFLAGYGLFNENVHFFGKLGLGILIIFFSGMAGLFSYGLVALLVNRSILEISPTKLITANVPLASFTFQIELLLSDIKELQKVRFLNIHGDPVSFAIRVIRITGESVVLRTFKNEEEAEYFSSFLENRLKMQVFDVTDESSFDSLEE